MAIPEAKVACTGYGLLRRKLLAMTKEVARFLAMKDEVTKFFAMTKEVARFLTMTDEALVIAKRSVIANEVKQSPRQRLLARGMDCFVALLLAMTNEVARFLAMAEDIFNIARKNQPVIAAGRRGN